MDTSNGGLYVHIPYCRKKCLYCDFFSGGVRAADWGALRHALVSELLERSAEIPRKLTSIYFGGGTPSAMPLDHLSKLMGEIMSIVAPSLSGDPEITIEINPEDVTEGSVAAWSESGFNRVSVGIQSFDDRLLASVGRRHTGEEAVYALRTLSRKFNNVSADIIFGLPGQTLSGLVKDIDLLLCLNPRHISVYSLMYEEGTAMTYLRNEGRITPVDDDATLEMFRVLSSRLRGSGYEHYEISNWACPGYESRHNSLYWTGAPYMGLGPSAHSYDGLDTRRANPPDLKEYFTRFYGDRELHGRLGNTMGGKFYTEEKLSPEELKEEFLLTRLRLRDGFDPADFRNRFGDQEAEKICGRIEALVNTGKLTDNGGRVALTEEGIMTSDSVILSLAR